MSELNQIAKTMGGFVCMGCLKGSPADNAGVKYGDIVLSVNGKSTPDMQSFVDAKGLNDKGMDVVVFRGGKKHHLSFVYGERKETDPTALVMELSEMRVVPTTDPAFAAPKNSNASN